MFIRCSRRIGRIAFAMITLMALDSASAFAAITVQTDRIAHGVSVWYAASSAVPVVDSVISFEGAGYTSDPAGKEGRAALAALMLLQGADTLDALAFQRALDDGAIQLTATSSADRLSIHLHTLRDQAVRGGELLALALSKPRFDAADLARMKTRLHTALAEWRESPHYQANRLFAHRAFAGHPYANDPYGTDASIDAITADDLRDYMNTYVTRATMRIAAAGDVDDSLLEQMLKPVIAASGDADTASGIATITMQGAGTQATATLPVPQTVVQFAAPAVARNDPKFYAVYLLNYILGGHDLTSRLMQEVRKEKGLVYGIGTDIDLMSGTTLISGQFATQNATVDTAITAVKQVLSDVQARGVTTQECADAKAYVIGSHTVQLDSSEAISSLLLNMQIYHLGADYLDKRTAYFNAVSCADINAAARTLLDPSRFLFTIAGGNAAATAAPPQH